MAVIDLKSAYTKGLAEIDLDKNKIADWEEVLSNLQGTYKAAYETEIAPIEQQVKYDISQAYSNYKKTQLNLLQNQQLGAGLREHLGSELQSSYGTTYSGIRREESSKLSSIGSAYTKQYMKDYEEKVKELEKNAANTAKIDEAVLRYAGINSFAEAEKRGYYVKQQLTAEETKELKTLADKTTKTSEEQKRYNELVDKQNGYVLTDKGKDLYSKTYLSNKIDKDGQAYGFYDYLLSEEDYGEEVADYYLANRAAVGELTAGFTAEEMGGSYDPFKYNSPIITPQQLESKTTQFDINQNPFGISKASAEKAFSASDLSGSSFENAGFKMNDMNDTGSKQDKWFTTLREEANKGNIPDGAIVDMNYGAGKARNYVYYKGYWYPTDLPATYKNPKDSKGKLERK